MEARIFGRGGKAVQGNGQRYLTALETAYHKVQFTEKLLDRARQL
jgi:hypothetical protein